MWRHSTIDGDPCPLSGLTPLEAEKVSRGTESTLERIAVALERIASALDGERVISELDGLALLAVAEGH